MIGETLMVLKILKMCAGLMLLEQWEATIENQVVIERRQECRGQEQ